MSARIVVTHRNEEKRSPPAQPPNTKVDGPKAKPTREQIEKVLPQILARFKAGFIEFLDGLIGNYPSEKMFIIIRVLIKDELSPEKIMDRYIEEFYPHRELIKSRDDTFFLAQDSMTSFDKDKLFEIRRIWVNIKMTADEKEKVFGYFDFFNSCVKKYQDYSKELSKLS